MNSKLLHKPNQPDTSPAFPVPWEALLAVLVITILYNTLSERLTIGPTWLLGSIIIILVGGIVMAWLSGKHLLNHRLALFTYSLITLAILASVVLLVTTLPQKDKIVGSSLLRDALLLWSSNVLIFALWYWQLDAGGPYARHHHNRANYKKHAELLFPQLSDDCPGTPDVENWKPQFIDYLFVAFNTSTAFSPTDTAVLSRKLKLFSMLQSSISLVILATLAARAVNIL